jgi:type IV pilus assembly protein PilV
MKNNKGFTLLEILISILILSIGLLGFARAQLISLRHNESAYLQTIATIQNNSLAERFYICNLAHSTACKAKQIDIWKAENKALLPQAESSAREYSDHYTIILKWQTPAGSTIFSLQTPL